MNQKRENKMFGRQFFLEKATGGFWKAESGWREVNNQLDADVSSLW